MNGFCYIPLPVKELILRSKPLPRSERRKILTGDGMFKPKGKKRQIPKRRVKPFGKHNKDRYHK